MQRRQRPQPSLDCLLGANEQATNPREMQEGALQVEEEICLKSNKVSDAMILLYLLSLFFRQLYQSGEHLLQLRRMRLREEMRRRELKEKTERELPLSASQRLNCSGLPRVPTWGFQSCKNDFKRMHDARDHDLRCTGRGTQPGWPRASRKKRRWPRNQLDGAQVSRSKVGLIATLLHIIHHLIFNKQLREIDLKH